MSSPSIAITTPLSPLVGTDGSDDDTSRPAAGVDAWAATVVDWCHTQGWQPDPNLCRAGILLSRQPWNQPLHPYTSASYSPRSEAPVAPTVETAVEGPAEVLPLAGTRSTAPHATAPCGPPASGTPTNLPRAAILAAYRRDVPCLVASLKTSHVNNHQNCAASPRCMAGLQSMRASAGAIEDCLLTLLGTGPVVLSADPSGAAATPAVATSTTFFPSEGDASSPLCEAEDSDVSMDVEVEDDSILQPEVRVVETPRPAGTSAAVAATRAVTPQSDSCLWRGLVNRGNTCYFNAIIQLLFAAPRVRRAVLAANDPSRHQLPEGALDVDEPAAEAARRSQARLKEVFAQMAFSRDGCGADPAALTHSLSINASEQQDAQEFFTLLLDWLRCHGDPSVKAAIGHAFEGTVLYDRRCGGCGRSTKRAESFLYLSLPVRPKLSDSFQDFLQSEEVEGFLCEGCRQVTVATSRQYIRTLPEILVIHLTRFEFDMDTQHRRKVHTAVNFPLTLDMSPYEQQWRESRDHDQQHSGGGCREEEEMTPSPAPTGQKFQRRHRYELRGLVNHLGESAISGHYTYYGKIASPPSADGTVPAGSRWLNFNDGEVTPLTRFTGATGTSKDAYMLVYYRLPDDVSEDDTTHGGTAAGIRHEETPPPSEAAAMTACVAADCPTAAEFPSYLLDYVHALNDTALERRRLWEMERERLAHVLRKWAEAARAIFKNEKSHTVGAKDDNSPSPEALLYCFPIEWLRVFGRGFMPPFVNVESFGEHRRRKNNHRSPRGPDGEAAATGRVIGVAGTAPLWQSAYDQFLEAVRTHTPDSFWAPLTCPHGGVAPWGAYKLLDHKTNLLLEDFLVMCGAFPGGMSMGHHHTFSTPHADGHPLPQDSAPVTAPCGGTGGVPPPYLLQAHSCCACVAAMAQQVVQLADTLSCDTEAMAQVPSSPLPPGEGVIICEDVLKTFGAFVEAREAWRDPYASRQGFTGVVALWWLPSVAVVGSNGSHLPIPPSLADLKAILADCMPYHNGDRTDHDEEDVEWDTQRYLTCPHKALRPDAAVRIVPETLWRYMHDRIPRVIREFRHSPVPSMEESVSGEDAGAQVVCTPMEGRLQSQVLPYVPAASLPRCLVCIDIRLQQRRALDRDRASRVAEKNAFPTLVAAGRFAAGGGDAWHSNRLFFQRGWEGEYREAVQAWRATQQEEVTAQKAKVSALRAHVQHEKEQDARWRSMTRGGRNRGRPRNRTSSYDDGGRISPPKGLLTVTTDDSNSPAALLAEAQETLAALIAAEPPDYTVRCGLLPMSWVVAWYQYAVDGAVSGRSPPPPPVSTDDFRCPHGQTLLEVGWLEPGNSAWQRLRARISSRMASGKNTTLSELREARAAWWHVPLLVVPMAEFEEVLYRYNGPKGANEEEAPTVVGCGGPCKTGDQDRIAWDSAAALEGCTLLLSRNGERVLAPATCSTCCRAFVDAIEADCQFFQDGTLRLQLHLRTSKRLFYDQSGIMTSKDVEGGLHHDTTLRELRSRICQYIMASHGLRVPGDKLEILRSGRKPLKVRGAAVDSASSPVTDRPSAVVPAVPTTPELRTASSASDQGPYRGDAGKSPGTNEEAPCCPSSIEDATLHALGIMNGDTLFVILTEVTAVPCERQMRCASGGPTAAAEEEWEEVPQELLYPADNPRGALEPTGAFRDSILTAVTGGGPASAVVVPPSVPDAPADMGVSCSVCTFLNAAGMVRCEMCESPLPH